MGLNVRDFYAEPGEQERWRRAIKKDGVLHDSEIQMRRKDGEVIWTRDSGRLVHDETGQTTHFEGTLSDITQRKLAQEELRESEGRYRDLVENVRELICTHDVRGRLLSFNRSAIELTGYAPDELLGIDMREFLPPDHRPLFERYLATVLKTGATNGLMTIVTRQGERRIWEYHNTLRTEGIVEPIVRGYARDITEVKQAEQALHESEERYRAVIHSASDAIISTDGAGNVVDWNPGAERMFGYTGSRDPSASRSPGFCDALRARTHGGDGAAADRRGFAGPRQDAGVGGYTEGRTEVSAGALPVRVAGGGERYYTAIIRDITERKHAEQALASGADEMKSLLQTSMQTLAGEDLHGLLTAIVESATRLAGGDRGALYMPTSDGAQIRMHVSHNMGRDYTGTKLELGEGISGRAAQERRAIMIEDYDTWEGRASQFQAGGIRRVLAVPMEVGDRLIGVLNVGNSTAGPFGEDEIRIASLFADQAAMAIESARLVNETNRRAAYLEALTSTAAALRAAV